MRIARDLLKRHLFVDPVVEPCRTRRPLPGDTYRHLKIAAVAQVLRDPGARTECGEIQVAHCRARLDHSDRCCSWPSPGPSPASETRANWVGGKRDVLRVVVTLERAIEDELASFREGSTRYEDGAALEAQGKDQLRLVLVPPIAVALHRWDG